MKRLQKGDKVAIVSLSKGLIGEEFFKFTLDIGIRRLIELNLEPVFMENSLKGLEFLEKNPDKRAEDLKQAMFDDSIKAIICAIGGDDTYRTLPYLLNDNSFVEKVKTSPKIFLGFSDSTINHLMFHKLGMNTFYGQSFVCEMCELEKDMLPYSKKAFMSLFSGKFDLKSSPFWYEERTDFSQNQIGVVRIKHKEMRGIETLQGTGVVEGSLLGGCLDSMYEILCGTRYQDQVEVCSQYDLFPSNEDWKDKILFFESSEEKPDEMLYRKQLESLKEKGVFKNVKGIIVGKPQDEINYDLYKKLIIEVVDDENLPILYNFNFGHSLPRACFPYGIKTKINIDTRDIEFIEDVFEENN